jgi:hypothetical protein
MGDAFVISGGFGRLTLARQVKDEPFILLYWVETYFRAQAG